MKSIYCIKDKRDSYRVMKMERPYIADPAQAYMNSTHEKFGYSAYFACYGFYYRFLRHVTPKRRVTTKLSLVNEKDKNEVIMVCIKDGDVLRATFNPPGGESTVVEQQDTGKMLASILEHLPKRKDSKYTIHGSQMRHIKNWLDMLYNN